MPRSQPPPWWPEDEPWPPERGSWARHRPGPFALRLGCLLLVGVALVVFTVSLVFHALGLWAPYAGPPPMVRFVPLLLLGILLFAAATRGARRLAGPLDNMVNAARSVEAGDYTVRVPQPRRGPYELRQLVRAFNTMIVRLEADEAIRRSLLADVSHELRTPLAVIRGEVEAVLDGVYPPERLTSVLDEIAVMSQLIEDLRTVALSEAGTLALHKETTDLGVLCSDVVASFGATAAAAGVTLAAESPDDLPLVDVDPLRIREVLGNLVANALAHTPTGGHVHVSAERDGTWLVLSVADTGTGMPPELQAHAFDRFVKGDDSRGSGLGLAIARSLVEAHGGSISAASATGEGTRMTVRLPVDGDR